MVTSFTSEKQIGGKCCRTKPIGNGKEDDDGVQTELPVGFLQEVTKDIANGCATPCPNVMCVLKHCVSAAAALASSTGQTNHFFGCLHFDIFTGAQTRAAYVGTAYCRTVLHGTLCIILRYLIHGNYFWHRMFWLFSSEHMV